MTLQPSLTSNEETEWGKATKDTACPQVSGRKVHSLHGGELKSICAWRIVPSSPHVYVDEEDRPRRSGEFSQLPPCGEEGGVMVSEVAGVKTGDCFPSKGMLPGVG
eukprot:Hpha_TRINITY_DN13323_c0_g1::TRINITY_DN13323_c0_g1_i2::g.95617::m.95617